MGEAVVLHRASLTWKQKCTRPIDIFSYFKHRYGGVEIGALYSCLPLVSPWVDKQYKREDSASCRFWMEKTKSLAWAAQDYARQNRSNRLLDWRWEQTRDIAAINYTLSLDEFPM